VGTVEIADTVRVGDTTSDSMIGFCSPLVSRWQAVASCDKSRPVREWVQYPNPESRITGEL
jgi:hypothetical protein